MAIHDSALRSADAGWTSDLSDIKTRIDDIEKQLQKIEIDDRINIKLMEENVSETETDTVTETQAQEQREEDVERLLERAVQKMTEISDERDTTKLDSFAVTITNSCAENAVDIANKIIDRRFEKLEEMMMKSMTKMFEIYFTGKYKEREKEENSRDKRKNKGNS